MGSEIAKKQGRRTAWCRVLWKGTTMNMRVSQRLTLSIATVLALVIATGSAAGAPAARLELGKYIPADVHFYAGGKDTPARARLMEAYWKAFEKLINSGIARDLFDLATHEMPPHEREQALAWAKRIVGLITKPDWKALARGEGAFAFKLSMPIPEYLVLFKVPKETTEKRRAEFTDMFKEIAGLAPYVVSVSEGKRHGAETTSMFIQNAPIAFCVATKGDVVALATSYPILDGALGLMDSPDAAQSIVNQDRFRKAFEGLPAPQDGQFYFDLGGYLNFLRGIIAMAGHSSGDPNAAGIVSVVDTILEEIARMHTIAAVDRTDGDRMFSDIRLSFAQENGPGFLEELIRDSQSLDDVGRVIPKDAVDFYATSGMDLEKIYDAILDLIRDRIPDGKGILQQWEHVQAEIGINLRRDFLSWFSGRGGYIVLPGGSWGTETVIVVNVKDMARAEEVITGIGRRLRAYLTSRGQKIEYVPVEGAQDRFREIRIEALPFLRPVVGLTGDALVISSSADAVRRVVASFSGEAPSLLDNPRFTAIGQLEGHVCEAYYTNLEDMFAGVANVLGTLGFIGSILPEDKETRPLIKLGGILTKAATFLRDIDLGLDYAGWSRYDPEAHAIFARELIRVRVPGGAREGL